MFFAVRTLKFQVMKKDAVENPTRFDSSELAKTTDQNQNRPLKSGLFSITIFAAVIIRFVRERPVR